MSGVRFNYVLVDAVNQRLTSYCALTHRNASDVVRQVLIEWVDGDMAIQAPLSEHPVGKRTNIIVSGVVRDALEGRTSTEGHVSVSAVVNSLLTRFLAARAPRMHDAVTVRLPVPVPTYQKLSAAATLRGEDVEQMILNGLKARVVDMVIALKEEI